MRANRLEENLRVLHPEENQAALKQDFYRSRIRESCMAAGVALLFFLLCVSGLFSSRELTEQNTIARNPWESGAKTVELTAVLGEEEQDISLTVSPRAYTQAELEEKFRQALPALEQQILADNQSADEVRSELCFEESLEGTPFTFAYESSNLRLIAMDGRLGERAPGSGGEEARICVTASCGEFERSYYMTCKVLPPLYSAAQEERLLLQESAESAEAARREAEEVRLPEEIAGRTVVWKEQKESYGAAALALGILCIVLLWLSGSQRLQREVKARDDFLALQYPELVSTLTLLLGAGMTVRGAFSRMLQERKRHGGAKDYLQKEMALLCHEMDTGIAESEAYTRFGKRCRLQQYRRLTALLVQNLRLGSRGLLEQLEYETHNALEEKRARARQAGEEAGSRLLLPMTAMLLLVMVLIIIPAFGSFGT